jgi:hypothetical protein
MEEKEYYSIKAVSSSSLAWFEKSPLYFRMKLDKEIEESNQRYFEFGKRYGQHTGKEFSCISQVNAYKKRLT